MSEKTISDAIYESETIRLKILRKEPLNHDERFFIIRLVEHFQKTMGDYSLFVECQKHPMKE